MIGTVSQGYEKIVSILENLGLFDEEREELDDRDGLDTALSVRIVRGRYELVVSDSNDQYSHHFDVAIRHLDTSTWIMNVTSAQSDPDDEGAVLPWSVKLEGIEDHPWLRRFLQSNRPELLQAGEMTTLPLLPKEEQCNPESPCMFRFMALLFGSFRQLPA